MIGTPSGTPSFAITGAAVSIRPLVAMPHGQPTSLSRCSSATAPGSGRTSPDIRL